MGRSGDTSRSASSRDGGGSGPNGSGGGGGGSVGDLGVDGRAASLAGAGGVLRVAPNQLDDVDVGDEAHESGGHGGSSHGSSHGHHGHGGGHHPPVGELLYPASDPQFRLSYHGGLVRQKPHGHGVLRWRKGNYVRFEGEFNMGNMTYGTLFFGPKGRSMYTGNLRHCRAEGRGELSPDEADDTLLRYYSGDWRSGLKSGYGLAHYRNRDVYEGEWRENKMCGDGQYEWADGTCFAGKFVDDEMHGRGRCRFANGREVELSFSHSYPTHVRSAVKALCGLLLTLTLLYVTPHLLEMAALPDLVDLVPPGDAGVAGGGSDGGSAGARDSIPESPSVVDELAALLHWPWPWLWPWSQQQLRARALARDEAAVLATHGLQGAHIHGLWAPWGDDPYAAGSGGTGGAAAGVAGAGAHNRTSAVTAWLPALAAEDWAPTRDPNVPFGALDVDMGAMGLNATPWLQRWPSAGQPDWLHGRPRGGVGGPVGGDWRDEAGDRLAGPVSAPASAAAGKGSCAAGDTPASDAPSTMLTVLTLYLRLHLKRQLHYLRLGMMVLFTLTGDLEDAMSALAWPLLCAVFRLGSPSRPWGMLCSDTALFWLALLFTAVMVGTVCATVIIVLPEGLSEVLRLVCMTGLSVAPPAPAGGECAAGA